MTSAILDLEPKEVWKHFEALTKIPRTWRRKDNDVASVA
jgi:hypothetical protein